MGDELFPSKRLCDVGVVLYDCEHKTPQDEGAGHPYLAIPNIRDGRLDLENVRRISDEQLALWNRRVAPTEGDVVVTRRGRVGDSARIPAGLTCAIGQNLVILRSESHEIDQEYLRWAVRGPKWRGEVQRMLNVGAVFDSLNCSDIPKMTITVPPIDEQRVIAEVLGALDDKIESNRRVSELLHAIARIEFDVWSSEVNRWRVTTFGECTSVHGGSTPKTTEPSYWGGCHAWATPTDVTGLVDPYLFATTRTITEDGLASCSTELHPPGSIFMTSRATIGAFAVNQVPCAANQGFIVVRPTVPEQRWFVFHEMQRRVPDMLDRANGSTFLEISRGTFKAMDVEVPIDEGEFDRLDAILAPIHARACAAASESRELASLRDTLLPELLSGRLRINDAEAVAEAVT